MMIIDVRFRCFASFLLLVMKFLLLILMIDYDWIVMVEGFYQSGNIPRSYREGEM